MDTRADMGQTVVAPGAWSHWITTPASSEPSRWSDRRATLTESGKTISRTYGEPRERYVYDDSLVSQGTPILLIIDLTAEAIAGESTLV